MCALLMVTAIGISAACAAPINPRATAGSTATRTSQSQTGQSQTSQSQSLTSQSSQNQTSQSQSSQSQVGLSSASALQLPPHLANTTTLTSFKTVRGKISPKSVTASNTGLVSAHNMMYTHTVTIYDVDGNLQHTVPDAVQLADFDIPGHPGTSRGAPVEGVYSPNGEHLYVSNYSMYGKGFGPEGKDSCSPKSGTDKSFVYRIDTKTGNIDQVIPAGAVPKYVAISPDGGTLLVSNWCTWDITIIDTATGTVRKTVKAGRYPRGMVFTPDGQNAFIANMGAGNIAKLDLGTAKLTSFAKPGSGPRHLVISPDGKYLYVTNNRSGTVVKLDAQSGKRVAAATIGHNPRSMAISTDGKALYVVAYKAHKLVKLDADTMKPIQTRKTGYHPIGVAYEPTKHRVWVANYGGTINIFSDTTLKQNRN